MQCTAVMYDPQWRGSSAALRGNVTPSHSPNRYKRGVTEATLRVTGKDMLFFLDFHIRSLGTSWCIPDENESQSHPDVPHKGLTDTSTTSHSQVSDKSILPNAATSGGCGALKDRPRNRSHLGPPSGEQSKSWESHYLKRSRKSRSQSAGKL